MVVNKTELISVRLKPAEKERVVKAANASDLRLSEYIRDAIAVALKADNPNQKPQNGEQPQWSGEETPRAWCIGRFNESRQGQQPENRSEMNDEERRF